MKKFFLALMLFMLAATLVLAACDGSDNSSSEVTESESTTSDKSDVTSDDSSAVSDNDSSATESEDSEDESIDDEPDFVPVGADKIKIHYCSYSEKPYFAMVGQCEDGATITAECEGETVSSESYKGWFSIRLKCSKKSAKVKLTQTVNGETVSLIKYTAKPITPSADMWPVVTGKNFQFFFQKMLPDFRGQNVGGDYSYKNVTIKVKNRLNQMRKNNPDAEIIYMVVPSSMSVYPELVPDSYKPATGQTRLDKTMAALKEAGATVIDLKELFSQHKDDEMTLYYKLDSHWADYGAYLAYDALFDHISQKFPDAAPRSVDEFNWNPDYYESGDMTYYLQMSQQVVKEYAYYRTFNFQAPSSITSIPRYRSSTMLCYHDAMTEQRDIYTYRNNLPNITVMRDSYSTQLYDLVAERANTTHYHGMWDFTWNAGTIAAENPDYVVYIVAEWNLDSIIKG